MNAKAVKIVNVFLEGLQAAAELTDAQFKNVRRNVKKHVSNSELALVRLARLQI